MLLLCRVVIVRDFYLKAHIWFSSKLLNSWAKSKDVILTPFHRFQQQYLWAMIQEFFKLKFHLLPYLSFSSFLPSPVNKLYLSCFPFSLAQATTGWCSYIAFVLGKHACLQHCVVSFSSSQAWNMLSCWRRWECFLYCHLGQMKFLSILAQQSWVFVLDLMWIMNLNYV